MIRVDEIDDKLWVSEVEQQPGFTQVRHYPVKF